MSFTNLKTRQASDVEPGRADLLDRLARLDGPASAAGVDAATRRRVRTLARRLERVADGLGGGDGRDRAEALLSGILLTAFPDRVAVRAGDGASATMVGGQGFVIGPASALAPRPGHTPHRGNARAITGARKRRF